MSYTDYNMNDSFEALVYVTDELTEFDFGTTLDQRTAIIGYFKYSAEKTTLQLPLILKKNENAGVEVGWSNTVRTSKDLKHLYIKSIDGGFKAVLDKFQLIGTSNYAAIGDIGNSTSTYQISNFRMVNQFELDEDVKKIQLAFDYFDIFVDTPRFKVISRWEEKEDEITVSYQKKNYLLDDEIIWEDKKIKVKVFTGATSPDLLDRKRIGISFTYFLVFEFESKMSRDKVQELIYILKDLFSVLMRKYIFFNYVLQNDYLGLDAETNKADDRRENLFINQGKNKAYNPDLKARELKLHLRDLEFSKILEGFVNNLKLQKLARAFVSTMNDNLYVENVMTSLTNGLETYYKGSTYPSNGKLITDLKKKIIYGIRQLPNELKKSIQIKDGDYTGQATDFIEQFSEIMKDTRDNVVHGDKENSLNLKFDGDLIIYTEKLKLYFYVLLLRELGIADEVLNEKFNDEFIQVNNIEVY
ncbi:MULTISPECIES: HEPN domain-containing protein [unclassified Lactococcus]|uniref:HEPN domain-containing protein n=1 Tax=unclassified Lactococcus TaxID=2643510 RepID=UPI0011CA7271|nr:MULTISPECIES: HEPN domain-containing protein [unclassified Lactococcus]MQW23220.1 hypothetical protein [Lactococcus sp. dk101]TXK38110.1 hypothetical protein FVP42_06785 [Lactococcus sp. dk310]TXK49789.1 hypothetical protein FVP43_06755 [Lactococcus sp. dk322]